MQVVVSQLNAAVPIGEVGKSRIQFESSPVMTESQPCNQVASAVHQQTSPTTDQHCLQDIPVICPPLSPTNVDVADFQASEKPKLIEKHRALHSKLAILAIFWQNKDRIPSSQVDTNMLFLETQLLENEHCTICTQDDASPQTAHKTQLRCRMFPPGLWEKEAWLGNRSG